MPPAEDATDAGRRAVTISCHRCGGLLVLRHAFEVAECACGGVRLSGPPWRPRVAFAAAPGGGWTRVEDFKPSDAAPDSTSHPVISWPTRRPADQRGHP